MYSMSIPCRKTSPRCPISTVLAPADDELSRFKMGAKVLVAADSSTATATALSLLEQTSKLRCQFFAFVVARFAARKSRTSALAFFNSLLWSHIDAQLRPSALNRSRCAFARCASPRPDSA